MKKLSKLTLRKIDVEQSDILQKRELRHILGGYGSGSEYGASGTCNVCKCYDSNKKELGNLGSKKDGTACWDACVAIYTDFHGHKCE